MKSVYERTNLIITEFNTEDVITTSGESVTPTPDPQNVLKVNENAYYDHNTIDVPGDWF